jgi:hypothetical protein
MSNNEAEDEISESVPGLASSGPISSDHYQWIGELLRWEGAYSRGRSSLPIPKFQLKERNKIRPQPQHHRHQQSNTIRPQAQYH